MGGGGGLTSSSAGAGPAPSSALWAHGQFRPRPGTQCERGNRARRPLPAGPCPGGPARWVLGSDPRGSPLGPLLGSSEALAVGRGLTPPGRGLRCREGASGARAGLSPRPLTPRTPFGAGAGSPWRARRPRVSGRASHHSRGLRFLPPGPENRRPPGRRAVRGRGGRSGQRRSGELRPRLCPASGPARERRSDGRRYLAFSGGEGTPAPLHPSTGWRTFRQLRLDGVLGDSCSAGRGHEPL